MKLLRLTLAFLGLTAAAAAQNIEFAATPYEAPAFSATFPSPDPGKDKPGVSYSFDDITTKAGTPTKLHNYTLSLYNDADAFLVLYCDIANARGDVAALDRMLDGALTQLDNAKPGPKTDSTLSGLPARAVAATGSYTHGQTTFNVTAYERIMVQNSRVWQAIVICDQTTSCTETDANKFFNSIKVR